MKLCLLKTDMAGETSGGPNLNENKFCHLSHYFWRSDSAIINLSSQSYNWKHLELANLTAVILDSLPTVLVGLFTILSWEHNLPLHTSIEFYNRLALALPLYVFAIPKNFTFSAYFFTPSPSSITTVHSSKNV